MTRRYFIATPVHSTTAQLEDAEAHHLLHVMRAEVGSRITIFDDSGAEFPATVSRIGRKQVELEVGAREEIDRELAGRLVVGVALPKGDRQRWLVEKLVELGAHRLVPLEAERAVAQPAPKALQRLQRSVIEASKQCGRNRLMELAPPQSPLAFLQAAEHSDQRWFADLEGGPANESKPESTATWIAVGPEGGWSPQERREARDAGWQLLSLGPRTLRVETAAVALATLAMAAELGSNPS